MEQEALSLNAKLTIVLELLSGQASTAELGRRYRVSTVRISRMCDTFLQGGREALENEP